jgi:hypothetical protein
MLTEFDHHAHSDFTKLQLSQMFALQLKHSFAASVWLILALLTDTRRVR